MSQMGQTVKIRVQSYDEQIDVFTLAAFGFVAGDDLSDGYDPIDLDDFQVPGHVLPALIGRYGEPAELLGQVFTVPMP